MERWNPYEEAKHEFAARDKKHEIRLEVRKWPLKFFCGILIKHPKTPKRGSWNFLKQNKIVRERVLLSGNGRMWWDEVFHHHHLHCFQCETESDKSFPRAKEVAFDVKAVQESQSGFFFSTVLSPPFPFFFQDYNEWLVIFRANQNSFFQIHS